VSVGWAPFEQSAIAAYPSRAAWDAAATELVATMLERWRLTALLPFAGGEGGSVLAVRTADGDDAVLKVGYPHLEAVDEAVGLEALGPRLAPRVLRQDAWTWSLLLERVLPGVPLSAAELSAVDALGVALELHRRLRSVRATVRPLSEVMLPFVGIAERSPMGDDPDLVVEGLDLYRQLLAAPAPDSLLHGDFNPGNVLSSGDGGWRIIDPKPMLGDPAFDLPPMLDQIGDPWRRPDAEAVLTARVLDAHEDARRVARWAFARAALDVSWYLEDDDREGVAISQRRARSWRAISAAL
jgi:streptomycin 6-kinase